MIRLVRAELMKVRSTKLVWWLLLVVAALVLLAVAGTVFGPRQEGVPPLDSPEGLRSVFASANSAQLLALVLGIIAMAGEWRHRTATSTFLATPRRGRLVAAKVLAQSIVGLAYGAFAAGLTVITAALCLSIKGIDYSLGSDKLPQVLLAGALATVVYSILGVGYGALVRNQIAAIVSALLWVTAADSLLVALLPKIGRWTPGGATQALSQLSNATGHELLPVWGGALVLTAYGIAFVFIGVRTTVSRDIT